MEDLQGLIVKGIRELGPRSQNVTKVFEVQQEKEETPNSIFTETQEPDEEVFETQPRRSGRTGSSKS